ncbi:MAG TPA: hypothetical protein VMU59_01610 [Caulobacteraceae bacterium]|nr:hypothetical protein [Caulobacteraceae bacterium]
MRYPVGVWVAATVGAVVLGAGAGFSLWLACADAHPARLLAPAVQWLVS